MKKEEIIKKFPKIKDVVVSECYIALSISQKIFQYEMKSSLPIFDYIYKKGYKLNVFEQDINKIVVIFEKSKAN